MGDNKFIIGRRYFLACYIDPLECEFGYETLNICNQMYSTFGYFELNTVHIFSVVQRCCFATF